jgi:hypothetical protein
MPKQRKSSTSSSKNKLDRNPIELRPKHINLGKLVEKHVRAIETSPHYRDSCRYFRSHYLTIAVLEKAGLLKPGKGLL